MIFLDGDLMKLQVGITFFDAFTLAQAGNTCDLGRSLLSGRRYILELTNEPIK